MITLCVPAAFSQRGATSDTAPKLRVTFSKGWNVFENQRDVVMVVIEIPQSQQSEQ